MGLLIEMTEVVIREGQLRDFYVNAEINKVLGFQ